MKTKETDNCEIIAAALADLIGGNPGPSFRSPEFAQLLLAVKAVVESPPDAAGYPHINYAAIGARALDLLMVRVFSNLHAERALANMFDSARGLH